MEQRTTTMARTTFFGTVRNSITNLMGGVRGYQNAAAWGVAFTTAYFLWIKPELNLKREQEARLALARESDRYRYIEKTRPTSQAGGTSFGKSKETS